MEKSRVHQQHEEHTQQKKIVNCGQATKDGWIGEGEARIVLFAFGRRMNNSFRRGCYHNTLQRLAPVAHETRLERLDPIITWHSPFLVPQTRSTGAGTLGSRGGGEAAIEGAIRKALSGPDPGSGHLGFPPARPFHSLLVGRMVTGGDSGGGSVWIWKEPRRRREVGVKVGRRRNGGCAGVGGCGSARLCFCWGSLAVASI